MSTIKNFRYGLVSCDMSDSLKFAYAGSFVGSTIPTKLEGVRAYEEAYKKFNSEISSKTEYNDKFLVAIKENASANIVGKLMVSLYKNKKTDTYFYSVEAKHNPELSSNDYFMSLVDSGLTRKSLPYLRKLLFELIDMEDKF